jgi:hypothetical protein
MAAHLATDPPRTDFLEDGFFSYVSEEVMGHVLGPHDTRASGAGKCSE